MGRPRYGGARYTTIALERFQDASILTFDVSEVFDRVLRKRCRKYVASGRLRPYLLNRDPFFFVDQVRRQNLLGEIDGVYSFDAMVHVDLHTLLIYWLSAAKVLRPGGVLAMNVADACSEHGFMKLLHDSPGVYGLAGAAGGHFMWTSSDMVETLLGRLGFELAYTKGNGRDLFLSAKLTEPDRVAAWVDMAGSSWCDV